MIRYTLTCEQEHGFSWFQSAEAFDRLKAAGRINCATCGSPHVEKALMAPAVRPTTVPLRPRPFPTDQRDRKSLRCTPPSGRGKLEYVGLNFVSEARAIHDGDKPNRAIYGGKRAEDARKLIEEGVPVAAPAPFMPVRKVN